jgi:hypothetical protein
MAPFPSRLLSGYWLFNLFPCPLAVLIWRSISSSRAHSRKGWLRRVHINGAVLLTFGLDLSAGPEKADVVMEADQTGLHKIARFQPSRLRIFYTNPAVPKVSVRRFGVQAGVSGTPECRAGIDVKQEERNCNRRVSCLMRARMRENTH